MGWSRPVRTFLLVRSLRSLRSLCGIGDFDPRCVRCGSSPVCIWRLCHVEQPLRGSHQAERRRFLTRPLNLIRVMPA